MAVGSMCGCRGCAWLWKGMHGCGGHAWLQWGVRACGGACMVGGCAWDMIEIRSMSGDTHPTGMHSCLPSFYSLFIPWDDI